VYYTGRRRGSEYSEVVVVPSRAVAFATLSGRRRRRRRRRRSRRTRRLRSIARVCFVFL